MDVSIMIEGQFGATWPKWQRMAMTVEELGFAGLYRSDHFVDPQGPGPDQDTLELWASLTWLASHTSRINFGPLVCPVSLRHPVITAWTAAAVDDLSGGRLRLGLGAGWVQREHDAYGFDLLSRSERMDRLEEALEVVTGLLRSGAPQTFNGRYYQLRQADLRPRPSRPGGPPIVIGGNGPVRTLPLAARYADEWNAVVVTPDRLKELNARLDDLVMKARREPASVRRSYMTTAISGPTEADVQRKLAGQDRVALRGRGILVGRPDEIARQIADYEETGIAEIMLQWLQIDDLEGLHALAEAVFHR